MQHRSTRRDFFKQAALAGAGFWVAGGLTPARQDSPNERVNIACIGVGGKGSSDTDQAGHHGNIVALCDVDSDFLGEKAQRFPKAKRYSDFRKLLEEMDKQIDAVTVSTPDHTHAPASMMAMKMGKHVYCQKPLTHTVHEARQMRQTAAKMGVCTQMGNQGTAEDALRRSVELIQSGIIGPVTEVHVWTNRPVWPQAPKIIARPKGEDPVPSYLAWDLWLGPAPYRPYHHGPVNPKNPKRGTYHDFNWRGWWDFGTGALGDMACHTANLPFMALKLGYPTSVIAENDPLNPETYPGWARVTYQFPARGEMPPVTFVWYEGNKDGKTVVPAGELLKGQRQNENGYSIFFKDDKYHFLEPALKDEKEDEKKDEKRRRRRRRDVVTSGCFLVGTKGVLFSPSDYGGEAFILREGAEIEKVTGAPVKLPRNGKGDDGMKAEWVKAIKEKKPEIALSNFNYAALLTETILLGNVAMKAGKKIDWDGSGMRITNDPAANQHLHFEYRKGWTL
jgi:predicted dehydrogenase